METYSAHRRPSLPDAVFHADKEHFKNFGQSTTDADRPSLFNETVAAVAEALQV